MAKVPFNSENKSQSVFDFPKLSLGQGEKARVVLIDKEPEMEFVHTLRSPKYDNGEPVMHSVRQRDGSYKDEHEHEFVGRFICLGNADVLTKNNGLDPKNCPICERADSGSQAFDRAQRRFAMHVVKYKTKPGSFKVQEPFGAELVVWAFTDRVFNQIVEMTEEHGDLRAKDLMLGPCENKQYQKFDINIGGGAEWMKDDDRKKYVISLHKENKIEDLVPIIARKVNRDALETEIKRVEDKMRAAKGEDVGADPDYDEGDDLDLDGFLEQGDAEIEDEEEKTPAEDDDSDDEATGDEPDETSDEDADPDDGEDEAPTEVPDPPKKKPAKKAAAKKAAKSKEDPKAEDAGSIEDLEDLLADLS